MLSALIANSVRLRVAVLAACVVLLVVGSRSIRRAPLDVFPEFAPPLVEIQTEAPGLSTDEVESLVTVPIEIALNGIPHVKYVRSKSVLGLSQVVLVLETGTDPLRVRQMVQERVTEVTRRLPTVANPPIILQPLSTTSRVMKIGIWSKTLTQRDITEIVLWTVRPKLMSVPGVANVAIWGQRDKQYQVLVNPARLRANGVSLDAVTTATREAVALEGGGLVDTPNQRIAVRHIPAIHDPIDLQAALVDVGNGAPIPLGKVADVEFGSPPPIGDAVINDGPGLLLI
ncbi:MAG: efflux RND transporter permease subunit, partial [Gemmataceae bacterium]